MNYETILVIQMRYHDGLGYNGSRWVGRIKRLNSGYVQKIELLGVSNGLNGCCEKTTSLERL